MEAPSIVEKRERAEPRMMIMMTTTPIFSRHTDGFYQANRHLLVGSEPMCSCAATISRYDTMRLAYLLQCSHRDSSVEILQTADLLTKAGICAWVGKREKMSREVQGGEDSLLSYRLNNEVLDNRFSDLILSNQSATKILY
jgi:hypothetical protein